jgi:DNA-binding transcriptional MerR regulator
MVESAARRTEKSPAAFRTISEVAEDLDVPQHVLRFWESKFPQVKPLKRGGGRRYYRPEDVLLLRRIRQCLYQEGYTIKGVQRLLREGAVKVVPRPAEGEAPLPVPEESVPEELRHALEEIRDELVELRAILKRALR